MIALGGPKLKLTCDVLWTRQCVVSMIALGGPKLKLDWNDSDAPEAKRFNDSTGWA